mgnify:CR=1 FL=1
MSASSIIPKKQTEQMGANLTPMIDMTFLLVVFFILISRISEVEQIPMELPEPRDAYSTLPSDQLRAVVNLPADEDGNLSTLHLNAELFNSDTEGHREFSQALAVLLSRNSELEVTLRADKRLAYSKVLITMNAISEAGSIAQLEGGVRMNLAIINESTKAREVADGV